MEPATRPLTWIESPTQCKYIAAGIAAVTVGLCAGKNFPLPLGLLIGGLVAGVFLYGCIPAWQFNDLPGPPVRWWLLMNVPDILKDGILWMPKWRKKYGNLFRFVSGRNAMVVVGDPEMIKLITTKKFKLFMDRPHDFWAKKRGLLFATGEKWAKMRGALLPLFHTSSLNGMAPMMSSAAELLTKNVVPSKSDGLGIVDVSAAVQDMAVDIIGQAAFGLDFGLLKGKDNKFAKA